MTTERLEVQRTIGADPASIFAVLCDPQGHVAIDSSGMLMDATGDPVTAVGDTFVVHMDREALNDYPLGLYDVTVNITRFVPDREIAWTIEGQIKPHVEQTGRVLGTFQIATEPIESVRDAGQQHVSSPARWRRRRRSRCPCCRRPATS